MTAYKPTCADCGGPRSPSSGRRCKACYQWRATMKRYVRATLIHAAHLEAVGQPELAQQLRAPIEKALKD